MKHLALILTLMVAAVGSAQITTNVQVTAKFTYDDGTPVVATIAVYNDATNAVIISQSLDANGKLSATLVLDPTVAYRVQGTDTATGNPFPFMLKTLNLPASIVKQIFTVLSASEVDVVLAKADDSLNSYNLVALPQPAISIQLSSCSLSGPAGARFANGFWTNVQPGTTWTCSLNLPVAKTYALTFTASAWGSTYALKLTDGATVTLPLTNTNSWAFSSAVTDKAQMALPSSASTLVITSIACCEQMSDIVSIQ